MSRRDIFRFEPFNIFQNAAWLMLDETDPFGDRRDTPCASPRLVVVGLGWLGESLVVQAAKNWRRRYKQSGNRLNLTLLDRFASQKTGYLMAKYPDLSTWCEVTSLDVEIESREFNEAQFLKSLDNKTSVTAIYVCLDDQSLGLAAALTLQDKTRDDRVPIILRLDQDDAGFAKLLPKSPAHAPVVGALQPFPLFKRTCNTDALRQTLTEKLARAIHEEYVSTVRHSDVTIDSKPLLKEWEKLTDGEKESSRLQADDIRLKLAAVQCGIGMKTLWHGDLFSFEEDQVEKLARMEHERWCEEKLAGGWQYAKVRDDKEKKHNCLLTWEELDEPTKEIDRNFARKIPALLASVDLEIYHLA